MSIELEKLWFSYLGFWRTILFIRRVSDTPFLWAVFICLRTEISSVSPLFFRQPCADWSNYGEVWAKGAINFVVNIYVLAKIFMEWRTFDKVMQPSWTAALRLVRRGFHCSFGCIRPSSPSIDRRSWVQKLWVRSTLAVRPRRNLSLRKFVIDFNNACFFSFFFVFVR